MSLSPGEYVSETPDFHVTPPMLQDFNSLGFILVRSFLSPAEVLKNRRVFEETDLISRYGYGIPDRSGRMPKMVLWNSPGSDVTGMLCRSEKVVGTAESLLGGEVYHYHSKLVMKEPRIGGRQEWHQDYGYWYNNGLLRPDALSVFIPLDKCSKANGCLQIISGSHTCGKIEHTLVAGQTGADLARVAQIREDASRFQHRYVEMSAGDALFFHSNLLHASDANDSPDPRWVMILAYNRADNSARSKETAGHHPMYTPLRRVPNTDIMQCGNVSHFSGKDFLLPENDKTVSAKRVPARGLSGV